MNRIFYFVVLLIATKVVADAGAPEMKGENGYVEPFRMFDNVYYIGDKWVSSYAVETSTGLVIIDTLDFPYSMWIPANLKKLGLDDKEVTHIFVTHGHSDHVGGAAFLQSLYSAKVIMTKKALTLSREQALKSKDESSFMPPAVESFAKDESNIIVGDTEFKFYITPGHTEGDMSIDFMVKEKGELYRAFVVGGHGTNFQNPSLAQKFIDSMDRLRSLALKGTQVTVNLSNHPHKNDLFENHEKGLKEKSTNPFISKDQFFRFIDRQRDIANAKIFNNSNK